MCEKTNIKKNNKRVIDPCNENIIQTLADIILIVLDKLIDKLADYIKLKDLEQRLKL